MTTLADRIQHAGEIQHGVMDETGAYLVAGMPLEAEMLMALARLEQCECGHLRYEQHGWVGNEFTCLRCKVRHYPATMERCAPSFPTLREPCAHEDVSYPEYRAHGAACHCQGRGWVPIQHDVVEKVLEIDPKFLRALIAFLDSPLARRTENLRHATLAAAVLTLAEEEKLP